LIQLSGFGDLCGFWGLFDTVAVRNSCCLLGCTSLFREGSLLNDYMLTLLLGPRHKGTCCFKQQLVMLEPLYLRRKSYGRLRRLIPVWASMELCNTVPKPICYMEGTCRDPLAEEDTGIQHTPQHFLFFPSCTLSAEKGLYLYLSAVKETLY
jgi:hypothetical protein